VQGRNVDEHSGGFYTTMQLDQDIGTTSNESSLSCALLKQFQRLLDTGWLNIRLPHSYFLSFLDPLEGTETG
jgi:hypothetical protein